MKLFKSFDGSGRRPRSNQLEVLEFLEENWNKADVFVLRLPTGAGKSFVARTIMREFRSVGVLTPNNALLAQYLKDYPTVNAFAGKKHYLTEFAYEKAKMRALGGENTFFNVASYLSLRKDVNLIPPEVIILDEADQIINYFESASGFSIPCKLGADTLYGVRKNLIKEVERLQKLLIKRPDTKAAVTHKEKIDEYTQLEKELAWKEPDHTLIVESGGEGMTSYKVKPVIMPTKFTTDLFRGQKVIMMSGSIFKHDVEALIGTEFKTLYYDGVSPIPANRRKVYIKPLEEGVLTYPINYSKVAAALREVFEVFTPLRPCIVHCTYSDMAELRLMFNNGEAIFHTKDTKEEAIAQWQKEKHKIFFAAGCTTGLDLKDDMCRLNIILKANYPSQADVGVRKRMLKADGNYWADLSVLRQFIQACGRSTRNEKDYSVTVVLDDRLAREVNKHYLQLPSYFKESLDFSVLRGREQQIAEDLIFS